jgi:NAD(P)-dependent dehydrogenase (short-subunit alcohol dehydrogenase family)
VAADHLPEGIRVNCVTPGTTDTPWIGRLLAAQTTPWASSHVTGVEEWLRRAR